MGRTITNTPEPRYVERAKYADNLPPVMEEHDSITGVYSVDGGFAIDYENGMTLHVPLEGTEDIIVDVDETNKMINIHLDAEVRSKLARMLVSPTQAPTEQSFVAIGTNNAQTLVSISQLKTLLGIA